jgi:hypothetical protein
MSLLYTYLEKRVLFIPDIPLDILYHIFIIYRKLVLFKSKMINHKGYFICSHYINTLFYRCPSYYDDEHLHCARCGTMLKNNIKLRKILHHNLNNVSIYNYKGSCNKLCYDTKFY